MGHTKYPSLSSFYLLISLSFISLIGKEWGERESSTLISNVSCCLRRKTLTRIQHLLRSVIQQWKWITNQLLHLIFTGRMVSYHLPRISCSRAVPIRTHKSMAVYRDCLWLLHVRERSRNLVPTFQLCAVSFNDAYILFLFICILHVEMEDGKINKKTSP